MAKILYAVCSEGMGHATRSKEMIEELSKKHKVEVIAGHRAYKYLSKYFKVHKTAYFNITYINNQVSNFLTFWNNFIRFPFKLAYNLKIIGILMRLKPDVIISDFEPFSDYFSLIFRIPLISVDSIPMLTKCKIDVPNASLMDFAVARLTVRFITPKARYYLIQTFFYPEIKSKNTFLFPPVLRKGILNAKTNEKDFIVVWQTSNTYRQLAGILKETNEKYVCYAFNKDKTEENIIFKKFDEREFIKDLANCKAVITNGGFTLISEAIYLKKPVLSVPVRKQFEQIVNGSYLAKLGYGEVHKSLTKDIIDEFVRNLGKYRRNLKKFKREDNSRILKKIEEVIKEIR